MGWIARIFLAGLIAALPLMLTIFVTAWLLAFLNQHLGPNSAFGTLLSSLGLGMGTSEYAPYLIGLGLIVAAIFLLGLLVHSRIGAWIAALLDRVIRRIPVISSVYDLSSRFVSIVDTKSGDSIKSMSPAWCYFGGKPGAAVLAEERAKLGPLGRGEVLVACVFCAAAALWIGAKPLTAWLAALVPGFPLRSAHVEAGIALAAALVLFCARIEGRAALEFASLRWVPWATLLLLGGGFSMAAGVQESGLSHWIGGELGALSGLSPLAQLTLASLAAVAISAVASNTATIGVMLPVLWGAVPREQAPALLFAATIACSCDFALPAGTPPNAIVFGSGYVGIPRMAKTGAWLDLVAAGLAAAWCWLVVDRVL